MIPQRMTGLWAASSSWRLPNDAKPSLAIRSDSGDDAVRAAGWRGRGKKVAQPKYHTLYFLLPIQPFPRLIIPTIYLMNISAVVIPLWEKRGREAKG